MLAHLFPSLSLVAPSLPLTPHPSPLTPPTPTQPLQILSAKVRFINAVINGELVISKRKKAELVAQLAEDGYPAKQQQQQQGEEAEEEEGAAAAAAGSSNNSKAYDYLLGMPLYSLTLERVEDLRGKQQAKSAELDKL